MEKCENTDSQGKIVKEGTRSGWMSFIRDPYVWLAMLARELHGSFVLGVVVVYGFSHGLGGSFYHIATDYYWKDVRSVQPSAAQVYEGITYIPWILTPVWGLLTDVVPVAGYQRRPYFIFAGLLGLISTLVISLHSKIHISIAVLLLTSTAAGVAIADVTIDACAAKNSIRYPLLAADIQSLCGMSLSIGALLGFSTSGVAVHVLGAQGALGLLSIPAIMLLFLGFTLYEPHVTNHQYKQVFHNSWEATRRMWKSLKCPEIWRPSLYMYISLALTLNIHEGKFYWYTDPIAGPVFSQEFVGIIFAISTIGSILGVLVYHKVLKDYSFHSLLFWAQLLSGISGFLDLIMVLRLNVKLGIPDYLFVIIDESTLYMINRIKWMPMLVLSAKLCPSGIEGIFFALLKAIDKVGLLSSSWGGGLLLHLLNVTRTDFRNLWLVILIRNIVTISPLVMLFLVPKKDQSSTLLPSELIHSSQPTDTHEEETIQLVPTVKSSQV
jgi:MFS family permease